MHKPASTVSNGNKTLTRQAKMRVPNEIPFVKSDGTQKRT